MKEFPPKKRLSMRLWATNFIIDLAFLIFLTSAVSWRAEKALSVEGE